MDRLERYDRVASALHWLIGAALLAQLAFGFLLDDLAPRGTPARASVINLHKSTGMLLGLLIVLRLAWRLAHRPPAEPEALPVWQRQAARAGHRALYVTMLVMPLSGWTASNFSRHGVKFFGHAMKPFGPDLPAVYTFFNLLHVASAWLFVALIAGHVLMVVKHAAFDHIPTLSRMWPWARRA